MTEQTIVPLDEMKVTDFYHLKLCFEYVGAAMVLEKLEELVKQFPKLAGVGLSEATAKAEVADMRTRMLTRNIRIAMQHGFDPDTQQLAMEVRKDGVYLKGVNVPDEVA